MKNNQAQMSSEQKRKKMLDGLGDHRHLIQTAVNAMNKGDLRQALIIATSIRVLIHETSSCKPLLKSLKSDYLDLPIMIEPRPPLSGGGINQVLIASFHLPIAVTFSTEEPKIRLNMDIDPNKKSIPMTLGAWWTQFFMNLPSVGHYSRRQLVLDMANKEAAHADPEISEEYKKLLESQFMQFKSSEDENSAVVNISRLLVGRLGIEMLAFLEMHFPQ